MLLLGGGSSCISCEFTLMIVVSITAARLEDCSGEQFSSDSIVGWWWGRGEGEKGIVG